MEAHFKINQGYTECFRNLGDGKVVFLKWNTLNSIAFLISSIDYKRDFVKIATKNRNFPHLEISKT